MCGRLVYWIGVSNIEVLYQRSNCPLALFCLHISQLSPGGRKDLSSLILLAVVGGQADHRDKAFRVAEDRNHSMGQDEDSDHQ